MRALALSMVGLTVGAGIFSLPADAAHSLGAAAILGYVLCALTLSAVGLTIAEAGSRVSDAGGMYAYAGAAFGPMAAAVVGAMLITADGVVPNAVVAVLLVNTLAVVFPALGHSLARDAFLVLGYVVVTLANVRGVRYGVALSQAMTVLKLVPLIALVVLGLPHIHWVNLAWHGLPGLGTIGHTTVLLYFAFMGFEAGLDVSGEVIEPERTVPRALFLALFLVALLYIGLQVVAQGVLGAALATAGAAPLADTARIVFGSAGAQVILWATILATSGLLVSDALSSPRAVHAIAERGFLPRWMAGVHPVHQTPARAIVIYHLAALVLALTGTFESLVIVGSSGVLLMYLVTSAAVLRLRALGIRGERPPFVARGGVLVPWIAMICVIALLATLSRNELLALAALVIVALLLQLVATRRPLSSSRST